MRALLPYHPKPKPDELFSSWLIRIVNGYEKEVSEFLDLFGAASYLHSSDIDRLTPSVLVAALCEMTGTDLTIGKGTSLSKRIRPLSSDQVQIDSVARPWLIPIGHSRRSGRTCGFQVCPMCLAAGELYFRWHWAVALFCCCPEHRILLVDCCPQCSASIHASPQGLLGLRRSRSDAVKIHLERCSRCGFDLRHAPTLKAADRSLDFQVAYELELADGEQGSKARDRFAVLRHLITLLYGENRGLETLRGIVASRSGVERVDVPTPYEPDRDIVSFEEADVLSRSRALLAASWLFRDWPVRFVECCREATVNYPALNRNAIRVKWYCDVAKDAYMWRNIGRRKAVGSDFNPLNKAERA